MTLGLYFKFNLAVRFWDLFVHYGVDMLIACALAHVQLESGFIMQNNHDEIVQKLNNTEDFNPNEDRFVVCLWRIYSKCRGKKLFEKFRKEFHKGR